ncbi:C-type lectin domain family 4 member M-like [Lytechinus pictus]|uniref:C-type lectin domain family 4 member M-like n=1 Tax=Lytechinus pictus TaxID=7653 RepID=UPI0030B9E864
MRTVRHGIGWAPANILLLSVANQLDCQHTLWDIVFFAIRSHYFCTIIALFFSYYLISYCHYLSESTSTQDDTTTTTTTLSTNAADFESTSTQDDTTTTTDSTTTLSTTAANSELTSTQHAQDDTTTTTDSTTTLSTTAANSELTSTQHAQDDTTTTTDSTTTLSTTAANSESTSTQDDTTTTTTTLSTNAADSESTSTQDDTTTTTTTLSTNAADSAPGWKCTSSKCYRLYDEQERVWADAKAFCSEIDPVNTPYGYRSPSLLFLNTEKEANDLLALQLGLTDEMWVWVNCDDQSTEGEFVCDVDGNGTPSSSFWWDQGEPNNYGGQDCVAFNRQWSELLKWNDISCSLTRHTICQFIVGQPEQ